MKIILLILISAILLSGCDDNRVKKVSAYNYTSNVRDVDGDYIMYDIERGTVTCREHKTRSELSCWNKIRL